MFFFFYLYVTPTAFIICSSFHLPTYHADGVSLSPSPLQHFTPMAFYLFALVFYQDFTPMAFFIQHSSFYIINFSIELPLSNF